MQSSAKRLDDYEYYDEDYLRKLAQEVKEDIAAGRTMSLTSFADLIA